MCGMDVSVRVYVTFPESHSMPLIWYNGFVPEEPNGKTHIFFYFIRYGFDVFKFSFALSSITFKPFSSNQIQYAMGCCVLLRVYCFYFQFSCTFYLCAISVLCATYLWWNIFIFAFNKSFSTSVDMDMNIRFARYTSFLLLLWCYRFGWNHLHFNFASFHIRWLNENFYSRPTAKPKMKSIEFCFRFFSPFRLKQFFCVPLVNSLSIQRCLFYFVFFFFNVNIYLYYYFSSALSPRYC